MADTCRVSSEELNGFRDGALSTHEAEPLAAHVGDCARCQAALADLDALQEMLVLQREAEVAAVPTGFADRVMGSLPEAVPSGLGFWNRVRAAVEQNRQAVVFSLVGAVAVASLVLALAPGLRSERDRAQESLENEAEIHSLEVSGTDPGSTVVLQSAEGNTVIWVVPPSSGPAGPPAQ